LNCACLSGACLRAFRVVERFGVRGGGADFSTKSAALLAIALGLAVGSSGCAYENT
jgi:hypothetical protein